MVREFGYEYDATIDQDLLLKTKELSATEKLFGAYCLRSGRDALKAIAREYEPCVVYLPALSCASMIHPFEIYGHKIRFYSLNFNYSVDLNSVVFDANHFIFVYMDYFGNESLSDKQLVDLQSKYNITFVEDRTHNLFLERTRDFQPDYLVASLRKWLPLPDGGLLWGQVDKAFSSDYQFFIKRLEAQAMRHEYLMSGNEELKKQFRHIFSNVSEIINDDEPALMSMYSYNIAKITDISSVAETRANNAQALIAILSGSPYISLIQKNTKASDLYVAFLVDNRDLIQKALSGLGIFNTVIWPLSEEQRNVCMVSRYVESHMLAAPCDQRYTVKDMEYIGRNIIKVIENVNG